MVGGSVVYYRYLLSQCTPADVLVLARTHERSAEFDAAAPYPIVRTSLLPCFGCDSRARKLVGVLALFPMLLYRVLRHRVSVLHLGNFFPDILAGWPVARLTGRRLIVTIHAEELTTEKVGQCRCLRPFQRFFNAVARWALRRCDRVLTVGGFTKSQLIACGVPEQRIFVITPGIDLNKSRRGRPIAAEIASRLAGKRLVLTVGRFMPRKGQDMTIRAMPRVLARHPNVAYVMAGGGHCDNYDECVQLVDQLNLRDHAFLLRDLDDESIAWLYEHCDVFVMANRTMPDGDTEGYGIVFLEAGAWGKPVVGGRAGGAVDAVDDRVTGILVDGYSEQSIADGIDQLLSDPSLAQRMGEAGRRKANDNSWNAKCRDYCQLVETLTHSRNTAIGRD